MKSIFRPDFDFIANPCPSESEAQMLQKHRCHRNRFIRRLWATSSRGDTAQWKAGRALAQRKEGGPEKGLARKEEARKTEREKGSLCKAPETRSDFVRHSSAFLDVGRPRDRQFWDSCRLLWFRRLFQKGPVENWAREVSHFPISGSVPFPNFSRILKNLSAQILSSAAA